MEGVGLEGVRAVSRSHVTRDETRQRGGTGAGKSCCCLRRCERGGRKPRKQQAGPGRGGAGQSRVRLPKRRTSGLRGGGAKVTPAAPQAGWQGSRHDGLPTAHPTTMGGLTTGRSQLRMGCRAWSDRGGTTLHLRCTLFHHFFRGFSFKMRGFECTL